MYLFASSVTFLEVFMSEQISGKRGHWLNIPSGDFIQILKLLQRSLKNKTLLKIQQSWQQILKTFRGLNNLLLKREKAAHFSIDPQSVA